MSIQVQQRVAKLIRLTAVALKMEVGPISVDEESDSEFFVGLSDCGIGIRIDTESVEMTGGVPRIGTTFAVIVSTWDAGTRLDPPSEDEKEIATFRSIDAAVAEVFATVTRYEAEAAIETATIQMGRDGGYPETETEDLIRAAEQDIEDGQSRWSETGTSRRR